MSSLQRYDQDGLELVIDTQTGEAFASIKGYARMSGLSKQAISQRVQKLVNQNTVKSAEIDTGYGVKAVNLIPAELVFEWMMGDNPKLALEMGKAGATLYLYGVAGYQVKASEPQPISQPKPQLPPADRRVVEFTQALVTLGIDITNPRFNQEIKDLVTDKILMAGAEPGDTPKETWLGVAEKAERLGYPVAVVTRFRSSLGKWVAKHADELDSRTESRLCNGTQRPIKLYRDCPRLTNLIQEYMDMKVLKS